MALQKIPRPSHFLQKIRSLIRFKGRDLSFHKNSATEVFFG